MYIALYRFCMTWWTLHPFFPLSLSLCLSLSLSFFSNAYTDENWARIDFFLSPSLIALFLLLKQKWNLSVFMGYLFICNNETTRINRSSRWWSIAIIKGRCHGFHGGEKYIPILLRNVECKKLVKFIGDMGKDTLLLLLLQFNERFFLQTFNQKIKIYL